MGKPRQRVPQSQVVLSTGESVREFNKRLHREGRFDGFQRRAMEHGEIHGLKYGEARAELAEQYRPGSKGFPDEPGYSVDSGEGASGVEEGGVRPIVVDGPDSAVSDGGSDGGSGGEDFSQSSFRNGGKEDEGSYWDSLSWALAAMGRHELGITVVPEECPGPRGWALFSWGKKSSDKFYAHCAGESRKQGLDDSVKGRVEGEKDIAEIRKMLKEIYHTVVGEDFEEDSPAKDDSSEDTVPGDES